MALHDPMRSEDSAQTLARLFEEVGDDPDLRIQIATAMAENPTVALYLVTPNLEIRHANDTFCRLLGYAREELVGRRLDTLLHPEDDRVTQALAETLRDPSVPGYTLVRRFLHRDGCSAVWTRGQATCIRDPATGRPRYGLAMLHDISNLMALRTERERLLCALRRQDRAQAIGTLTAKIAHDFNNLLGTILGFSELAQRNAEEGSPLHRHLGHIRSAANRAHELIEHLTAFRDNDLTEYGVVSLTAAVREALALLSVLLPTHVRLQARLPDKPCDTAADEGQLNQLVTNLCTNAARAMPQGGTLTVSVDSLINTAGCQLSEGYLAAGEYVRLRVEDEGVGIATENRPNLFDNFYSDNGGSGLGLAIVKSLTESLHGQIDLESRPGEGTRFDIYLPSASRPHDLIDDQSGDPIATAQGEHVLWVDDEAAIVRFGEQALTELGFRVTGMTDSVSALRMFQADPNGFDMLLTDLTMPEMNGLELAQAAMALRSDLPVVLIAAHVDSAARDTAGRIGIREIVRKPFALSQLSRCIAQYLDS